jgi:hypothetical protein
VCSRILEKITLRGASWFVLTNNSSGNQNKENVAYMDES